MRLALDEDETRIADEARKLMADVLPIARLHHGDNGELSVVARRKVAELGWFGLVLPEEFGGAALSEIEFALFFREAGRQCAPIELLSQSLAVLLTAQQPEVCASLLRGDLGVSLLVADADGHRLLGAPGDFALDVDAGVASLRSLDNVGTELLAALDPATSLRRISTLDLAVSYQLADARIWRYGQLGVAAMLVGIAEAALDQLVGYAKIRETFGKPIGSYQAVRHPCADIATRLEAARCQLWFAAAALKESQPDAVGHLDAAKHLANESAAFATDLNIQLHGGIGVTDEHDAHILLKHALLLRKLFGSKRRLLKDLLHAQFGT